jgi:hypothetical protein
MAVTTIETGASLEIGANTLNVNGYWESSGELIMTNANGIMNISEYVAWYQDSNANVTDGIINVSSFWKFFGANFQFGTGNTVNFIGSGFDSIEVDGNCSFGKLVINKTGGSILIHPSSDTLRVNGDMIIESGNTFNIEDKDLLVCGTLNIKNGGHMNMGGSGSLTNNSDFTLNGELDVGSGDALIHGDFTLETT